MSGDPHAVAARWYASVASGDTNWDEFASWLETDPRHRVAYDEVAALNERSGREGERRASPTSAPREGSAGSPADRSAAPRRHRARRPAIAAGVALTVAIGSVWLMRAADPAAPRVYTAGKNVRRVALADGSAVTLAPGSELKASADRSVPLSLTGRAHFDVRHDPASPMLISAGGYEIRDVGTSFDVAVGGAAIEVAVAEGSVEVSSPSTRAVALSAGERISATGADAQLVSPVAPSAVGRWRNGTLVYDGTPLAIVAADIARTTGRPVEAVGAAGQQPFSGVVPAGDRDTMARSVAAVSGVDTVVEGDTLRLRTRDRR